MGDKKVLYRLLVEMRPFYASFVGATLLYAPITILALAQPYMIGEAVERVFRTKDLTLIAQWSGLFLLIVLFHSSFEMLLHYLMRLSGLKMVRLLRQKMFAKVQRLPAAYFDKTPLGRVLTRMTNDTESLSELFSSGAVTVVGDLCFLAGTLIMLFAVDVKLSFAGIAVLPVLVVGLVFMRSWMRAAFLNARLELSKINVFLQEYLSGMQTVQLFSQVDFAHKKFDNSNNAYTLANRKTVFLDALIYSFVDVISTATVAVVLWAGMNLHEQGVLGLGVMVIFIEALSRFFQPVRELANKYAMIQNGLVASDRVFSLLDAEVEVDANIGAAKAAFVKDIAFQNVSFAYDANNLVLRDINFTVNKGQKIALVGHTGAGKSTVSKLLTRFYEISQGEILFDGQNIKTFTLSSLRQLFNVVPQEVFLFEGTLRDNLRYGRNESTDAEILKSLEVCQGLYLLDNKLGLDTIVNRRGLNFSLGERQLLSLTRALVVNSPILILDEATSGVDVKTERLLKNAIHEVLKQRTAFIIAHRLSTIKDCDQILVFSKGKLVENGTHEILLHQNGLYAKLVELQKREDLVQKAVKTDAQS